MAVFFLTYSLKTKSYTLKVSIIAFATSAAFFIVMCNKGQALIQSTPILVLLTLLYIFSKSLLSGNVPVITQFADCIDNKPLNANKKKYTRTVTVIWVVGFMYMLVQNVVVFIWFSIETWSWVSNFGNYAILTLIMLIEFLYRNIKFKDDKISFKVFIIRLSRCRLKNSL
ncbi:COG4648 family protein [Bathymodiolus septemdierum thioautotrophic gill symbiont]|nr:hypothetical protein [Bathymodiolus septemdierum thioautotrophic gill symbiont]